MTRTPEFDDVRSPAGSRTLVLRIRVIRGRHLQPIFINIETSENFPAT
jgi:hypothetical protein